LIFTTLIDRNPSRPEERAHGSPVAGLAGQTGLIS
jgi:hypothetical protein